MICKDRDGGQSLYTILYLSLAQDMKTKFYFLGHSFVFHKAPFFEVGIDP